MTNFVCLFVCLFVFLFVLFVLCIIFVFCVFVVYALLVACVYSFLFGFILSLRDRCFPYLITPQVLLASFPGTQEPGNEATE